MDKPFNKNTVKEGSILKYHSHRGEDIGIVSKIVDNKITMWWFGVNGDGAGNLTTENDGLFCKRLTIVE